MTRGEERHPITMSKKQVMRGEEQHPTTTSKKQVARGEEQHPTTMPSMSDERGRTTTHNNVRQQPMERIQLIDEGDEGGWPKLRRMMQICVPVNGWIWGGAHGGVRKDNNDGA